MPAADSTTRPPCSVETCGRDARNLGWCVRHYQRWRKYGNPLGGGRFHRPRNMSFGEAVEWYLSRAEKDGECLISTNRTNSRGYVIVAINGRRWRLHRAVLVHCLGRELKADEEARHRCHRTECIKPDHLEAGSHQDNMDDMVRAGRGRSGQRSGENNSAAVFTSAQVEDIRIQHSSGVSQAELARRFQSNSATICRIVNRVTYA